MSLISVHNLSACAICQVISGTYLCLSDARVISTMVFVMLCMVCHVQLSPYPNDEDLQHKLDGFIEWQQFCVSTLVHTLRHIGYPEKAEVAAAAAAAQLAACRGW